LPELDPKSSASTNSATLAYFKREFGVSDLGNLTPTNKVPIPESMVI
jgi:hypothetical protein